MTSCFVREMASDQSSHLEAFPSADKHCFLEHRVIFLYNFPKLLWLLHWIFCHQLPKSFILIICLQCCAILFYFSQRRVCLIKPTDANNFEVTQD